MTVYAYLWSDEQGENADKVQQHGPTRDEWQSVFENYHIEEQSRSSDRLIRIGTTADGRNVCVVFEWIELNWCVLPITGYEDGRTVMKNNPARKIPKLTSAIRDRMRKAIAEEEQPHVIAATRQQAREAISRQQADDVQIADLVAAIAAERERQHLSLENLKLRTGIDRANLSRLFRGEGSPNLDTLKKLAAAVGKRLVVTLTEQ